ncbi:MAG: Mur ligase family protein [Candidatus Paceibacterota bacterium]|jgi:UDP-N-acetylmuramate--alanine ligase
MDLDLSLGRSHTNEAKIKNVHFIGIGGIGISAVARMMLEEGKNVTGQDMQDGEIVNELRLLGIDIKIRQSYENIPKDTDLVVYTIAIEYYDPELFKKLKERNDIAIKSYPEMLGVISKDKYTIAICGTHGKTTTTGMISQILIDGGKDPMVIVGSLLKGKTNFIAGKSDLFVVEACEYRRSFLNINPNVLVITNIDEDHLDYYKDIEDIKNAFHEMVMKVPEDGYVICNPDDENISDVIKGIKAKVINWQDYFDAGLKLKIPGIHNKKDAAAAMAAAATLGISQSSARGVLAEFPGTWKRFEFRGKLSNGILLYDDYAHHPTEIMATLEGFRELYPKTDGWKITVIFQPHLFSRTKLLLDDFAKSFSDADEVLVLPIYYAREVDDGTISSEILAGEINKHTNNAKSFSDFNEAEKSLEVGPASPTSQGGLPEMGDKNIIVTMGAGEASKIGDFLLKK